MIRNYFKVAFRNLLKYKLFSFINIFGLALSMSICMLVLLRIKDQLAYDQFHPNTGRIYRLITDLRNRDGAQYRLASSPLPLVDVLEKDFSVLENWVRLYPVGVERTVTASKELSIRAAFTDQSFFEVFGFTLSRGSATTVLSAPNSIVLTKATAERFFGSKDPVGQVLHMETLGDFQVAGVIGPVKGKSHIDFDAYLSMSSVPLLEKAGKRSPALDQWNNVTAGYTYVVLKQSATEKQLKQAVQQIASRLQSDHNSKERIAFDVQPFSKIILGEELFYSLGRTGSRGKVLAEIGISFIILLSACFNYTNLSIARSLSRGKEVGIRKVSGAQRFQIFSQFVVESLFMSLLALGLAYVFLKMIIDFAPFSDEMIPAGFQIDIELLGWFLLFSLFTGLLAGVLPAWALSSFNPVQVLKNLSTVRLFGGNRFRKGLIIAQFTLCLVITIFTTVFSRQFNYMANADPGFNREHVLSLPLNSSKYQILSEEISRVSGVQMAGATSEHLGINASGHAPIKLQPEAEPIYIDYFDVDANFIQVMELKLLAGNTFPSVADTGREQFVIINEAALKPLHIANPTDAIGKMAWLDDSSVVHIAGVVKNFYYEGLERPVTPLLLRNRMNKFNFLAVKTAGDSKTILQAIKAVWLQHNAGQPFEIRWLADVLYEKRSAWTTVSMLGFLSFIAVTIACLGLLGMVMYTTETRRKEIGIRKVMGASVAAIISLLSRGFIKLIIIAGLIALPVSYILGYLFLNMFANRISLGLGSLIICFFGLLLLVLVTIGSQIYMAAIANPAKNLRTE
ncbi:ABC transporter permease [Chitinophagaceae bacterium LB-8]|uniref:ABC transporter permease n=1 Tax=Paraflavisolibacter caeni TaxID=2982496 RepID=A0A9X2XU81_9BACT|nr:ABC transporter permease [Paraflavisolibacter caeni]MCU7548577.1 ABC transporter permease [Paraflavisolibacter caeni]